MTLSLYSACLIFVYKKCDSFVGKTFSKSFHYKKQDRNTSLGRLVLLFLLCGYVCGVYGADAPYGYMNIQKQVVLLRSIIIKNPHK